jgi:hypothetical protein
MFDMVNVFVDPHLITLPNPCQSVEDLQRFINSLLEWASTINKDDINVLISQTAVDALYKDGSYPYDHELRRLLQQFPSEGGPIADEETVCQLVMNLLQKTPYLEERINIEDILYDESSCQVEPTLFLNRLTTQASGALQTCLVMLGLWQQTATSAETPSTGCIFATAQDSTVRTYPELTVQASVELVIPFPENSLWVYTLPAQVDESFHICLGHGDILQQVGCFKLWNAGKTEAGARDAIDLRIQELIQQGSANRGQIAAYTLGPKFLASAQQWGFQRSHLAMILIDSCARILAGIPSKPVKPFRKSENSSDQRQRVSDQALAWRNHLTKGGPGYRLMYWQKTMGEIEFANVGPKKELIIHE